jgi:hypothetical protein
MISPKLIHLQRPLSMRSSSSFIHRLFAALGLLFLSAAPGWGQVLATPVAVPVDIVGRMDEMGMNPSTSQPVSSTASLSVAGASDSHNATAPVYGYELKIRPSLIPGKDYNLTLGASQCGTGFNIYINPPPGYRVYIEDVCKSGIRYTGTPWVQVPPTVKIRLDDGVSLGAGDSSSIRPQRVVWSVGLGSLKNGSSAGSISIRQVGVTASTFSISSLFCGSGSAEVQRIYDQSGRLRQVFANTCLVNITPLPSGSEGFTIDCYARQDVSGTQGPLGGGDTTPVWNLVAGALPFVDYRFENPTPGTYTKVRITKHSRLNSTGTTAKTWTTELRHVSGSPSGTDVWAVVDWTQNTVSGSGDLQPGDSWSRWTYTNNGLNEQIEMMNAANTVATKTLNLYQVFAWGAELVETDEGYLGSNPRVTKYAYCTDLNAAGNYSRLLSVTKPSGEWIRYAYYDDNARRGLPKTTYQPWKDAPATAIAGDYATGLVTDYDYAADLTGIRNTRPASTIVKVGGSTLSKSTIAYQDLAVQESVTLDGTVYTPTRYLVQATRTDYANATTPLTSVSTSYREDAGMEVLPGGGPYEVTRGFFPGMPYSSTAIDGTQSVWTYTRGVYMFTYHLLTPLDEGSEWLVSETREGPAGLEDGSTYQASVRSYFGQTIVQESGIYSQGSWHTTTRTVTSHLKGLLPLTVIADNGVNPLNNWPMASKTWVGGELTSETDAVGIQHDFEYSSSGWLHAKCQRQKGNTPDGDLWTVYGYDGAHHLTSTRQQTTDQPSSSAEDAVVTTAYDTAGRVTSVTKSGPGGNITTTTSYPNAVTTTTTNTATTGTTTRTMFLDGRLKSVSGSALFGSGSTTYDYGFDSSGNPYVKETPPHGGYTYRVTDWMGRPIRSTTPGYNGARIAQVSTYDAATGRLIRKQTLSASSSDQAGTSNLSPPLLYEYDAMGRLKRECVDANENGMVDLGGSDRITEYEYSVNTIALNLSDAVGGNCSAIWSKIDVFTYPDSGSATRLRLGSQLEQLNGYAAFSGGAYTIYANGSITRNGLSANDGSDDAGTARVTVTKLIPSWAGVITETSYPGASGKDTTTSVNGFLTLSVSASGVQTTDLYDAYGRLFQSQGREQVMSEYAYYPGTRSIKNIRNYNLRPNGASGSEWKQLTYDAAGRLAKSERNEVGHWRQEFYDYDQRDNLRHVWGSGTTPVEYVYDDYNRKIEMHLYHDSDSTNWSATTWPTGATADVTHWTYDPTTGLVTSKTSPNAAHSVSFAYNGNNQLVTRTWARGVVTQYDYYDGSNPADGVRGQLKEISYPGSTTTGHQIATQPVSYTYFRHGAVHTVTEPELGAGVRTFTYRPQDLQLSQETLPDFFGSNQKKLTYKYEDGVNGLGDASVAGRLAGFEFGKSTN